MRTRSFISSSNPMSSASSAKASAGRGRDGHRTDGIGIGTCGRQSGEKTAGHITVLLHEAIEQLAIKSDDVVVDATLGGGGHAAAIAKLLGKKGILVGMDLDQDAIERTRIALEKFSKPMGLASAGQATKSADSPVDGPQIHLVTENFRNLSSELGVLDVTQIDKALFDLGWSGYQLESGRGFSFLKDEPLSMTYAKAPQTTTLTAATIVNEWAEESIADVIFGWGEERYSRRIAKRIVESRAKTPIRTSLQLAEIIRGAVPPAYRHGRIHPATRTFQALRIAVNDELGALKEGLTSAWAHLSQGGRIAVITFHSIEDREVKRLFVKWEQAGEGKRITPKDSKLPTGQARKSFIVPSAEEIAMNPRSRSAKLRVVEKAFQNLQSK